MSNQNENLGGRLPLLDPKELAPDQAKLYKVMDDTLIAWGKQSGFVVKTNDGKFIGPFNPSLYSPGRLSRQVNRQRISPRMNLSLTASLDSLVRSAG